jgi:hypothetical protein
MDANSQKVELSFNSPREPKEILKNQESMSSERVPVWKILEEYLENYPDNLEIYLASLAIWWYPQETFDAFQNQNADTIESLQIEGGILTIEKFYVGKINPDLQFIENMNPVLDQATRFRFPFPNLPNNIRSKIVDNRTWRLGAQVLSESTAWIDWCYGHFALAFPEVMMGWLHFWEGVEGKIISGRFYVTGDLANFQIDQAEIREDCDPKVIELLRSKIN